MIFFELPWAVVGVTFQRRFYVKYRTGDPATFSDHVGKLPTICINVAVQTDGCIQAQRLTHLLRWRRYSHCLRIKGQHLLSRLHSSEYFTPLNIPIPFRERSSHGSNKTAVWIQQFPSSRYCYTQVDGLEHVSVSSNSTSAGDSCDWFVTFTDTPGNQDQVEWTMDGC